VEVALLARPVGWVGELLVVAHVANHPCIYYIYIWVGELLDVAHVANHPCASTHTHTHTHTHILYIYIYYTYIYVYIYTYIYRSLEFNSVYWTLHPVS